MRADESGGHDAPIETPGKGRRREPENGAAIAWRRPAPCCDTEEGRRDPNVEVDLDITDDGEVLSLDLQADHPCGLSSLALTVTIEDPEGPWVFEVVQMGDGGPRRWRWGPDADHRLPVAIRPGTSVSVEVLVMSECGTGAQERLRVARF